MPDNNIRIRKQSGIFVLRIEQTIDSDIDTVWDFFATPKNLQELTPRDMDFRITSDIPSRMYPGQIITYSIAILPLLRSNWVTEITHISDKKLFIDEQRFGPYTMWHHEHHFDTLEHGKVLMTDIVSYKLPFGLIGNLIAGRVIRKVIIKIFKFRKKKIEEIFI